MKDNNKHGLSITVASNAGLLSNLDVLKDKGYSLVKRSRFGSKVCEYDLVKSGSGFAVDDMIKSTRELQALGIQITRKRIFISPSATNIDRVESESYYEDQFTLNSQRLVTQLQANPQVDVVNMSTDNGECAVAVIRMNRASFAAFNHMAKVVFDGYDGIKYDASGSLTACCVYDTVPAHNIKFINK